MPGTWKGTCARALTSLFSHMKCETLDSNFVGKKFQDYVHANDVSLIVRHFEEGQQAFSVHRLAEHRRVSSSSGTWRI